MSSLKDRAAASWRETSADAETTVKAVLEEPISLHQQSEALPEIEYTAAIRDAEPVPVHVAWARVMADVQSIAKGDERSDSGGRYKFRGVDRVINAVGPALRRHGVLVLPTKVFDVEYRELTTKAGGSMQECTLKVQWTVRGPMGDDLPVMESAGQANDTADKGTAKAESVAHRVFFLTSLQIPTQEPTIDQGHDRGERPVPRAADYVAEILSERTSAARLRTIFTEVGQHGLIDQKVRNEHGEDETLRSMLSRKGEARRAESGGESV